MIYNYIWSVMGDVDSPCQIQDPQSVSIQGKVYVNDLPSLRGAPMKVLALEGKSSPGPSSRSFLHPIAKQVNMGFGIKQIQVSTPEQIPIREGSFVLWALGFFLYQRRMLLPSSPGLMRVP